jgi:hypothetical protein
MDQGPNIHRVAMALVREHGDGAYAYLRQRAEQAKSSGDRESAITWWDIALAAVEIQKSAHFSDWGNVRRL